MIRSATPDGATHATHPAQGSGRQTKGPCRLVCCLFRHLFCLLFLLFPCLFLLPASGSCQGADSEPSDRPLRAIYWEGGPFYDHKYILQGLAQGLFRRGLVRSGAVPLPADDNTQPMWQWLSEQASGRIAFLADGYYSSQWQTDRRALVRAAIARRLAVARDVDLVIAFDTWSAQDALALNLNIPVLVCSVTTLDESGLGKALAARPDHTIAIVHERDHVYRQVQVFRTIFGFSKLGVVYEDTPSGRSLVGMEEIERAARDFNFSLVRCTSSLVGEDAALARHRLGLCHRQLVREGAEAVFLTYSLSPLQEQGMEDVLEPLIEAGLPTFSEQGGREVAAGALLSSGKTDQRELGLFAAGLLDKMIRGTPVRELDTSFVSSGSMLINLKTASRIGWDPPLEVLATVDAFVDDSQDADAIMY